MEYFQLAQYVFIGIALIVLLVRAFSIRERIGTVTDAREALRTTALEVALLQQGLRKEKMTATSLDRLLLLKSAQRHVQTVVDDIGSTGSNWRLDLFGLVVIVDIIIDLFGVAVMLMFSAVLLEAFTFNIDVLRILLGVQILGSLVFPYILKKLSRVCDSFLFVLDLKTHMAESILHDTLPKHVADTLLRAERGSRISG
ncbi:hypothetical protein K8R04_04425 [Candidatus Uhrbacteria bacterium]|nr:hypothetical protein [Candidatus Uhrbacteria bacterium]